MEVCLHVVLVGHGDFDGRVALERESLGREVGKLRIPGGVFVDHADGHEDIVRIGPELLAPIEGFVAADELSVAGVHQQTDDDIALGKRPRFIELEGLVNIVFEHHPGPYGHHAERGFLAQHVGDVHTRLGDFVDLHAHRTRRSGAPLVCGGGEIGRRHCAQACFTHRNGVERVRGVFVERLEREGAGGCRLAGALVENLICGHRGALRGGQISVHGRCGLLGRAEREGHRIVGRLSDLDRQRARLAFGIGIVVAASGHPSQNCGSQQRQGGKFGKEFHNFENRLV